eukprot:5095264-Ditylum_brightwellii.AAC.1
MPEIFEVFPESKEAVVEFIDGNLGDIDIKTENESDDINDGSTPIQVTKLRLNIELQSSLKEIGTSYIMSDKEKQHYNKSLLLKGLVPAACSARSQDFSAKLENKAA